MVFGCIIVLVVSLLGVVAADVRAKVHNNTLFTFTLTERGVEPDLKALSLVDFTSSYVSSSLKGMCAFDDELPRLVCIENVNPGTGPTIRVVSLDDYKESVIPLISFQGSSGYKKLNPSALAGKF